MAILPQHTDTELLLDFFEYLFEKDEGYAVIATTRPPAKADTYNEQFFEWPKEKERMLEFIDRVTPSHNVYYCVNVFSVPRRKKENALPQNLVWADLDHCRPDRLDIPPQMVVESSPNKFQSIWRLDQKVDPTVAENYSKRIAYHHADRGVDKGWATTKMLRVPGTFNFKYEYDEPPRVELRSMVDVLLPIDLFEALPEAEITDGMIPDTPMPDLSRLDTTPEMILYHHQGAMAQLGLTSVYAKAYSEEPDEDWSKALWRLISLSFDAGMSAEEVFVIAKHSKCNKYDRDERPDSHLWRDVLKAQVEHEVNLTFISGLGTTLELPQILTPKEIDMVTPTIIDDYMEWATGATDAVPVYHELGCTVLLSTLMSASLRLDVRNTKIVPNLWGLILGDSTLTRKTTAMDMAMDMAWDIEQDLMLGSDASAEGLMTALSLRPKQVSVFYRDEVTGFFSAIQRKEYMSAVPEIMTKVYDVPRFLVRRLRKDTYHVVEPIFIFFGGGIRDKLYAQVTDELFTSGFIPRYLIVNGFASSVNVQPLGPSDGNDTGMRNQLLDTFRALYSMYSTGHITLTAPDGSQSVLLPEVAVIFEEDVWTRAAEIEKLFIDTASRSMESDKALPTFSRLFISMLKITMLFAAARQEPVDHKIVANMGDLINAASYIQKWGKHTVDLILSSGMGSDETIIQGIYRLVEGKPGVLRGQVMNRFRLDARKMQLYEETLIQRMLIQVVQRGRARQYYAIGK